MFSILMFLLIFVLMCVADSFIPLFPTSPGLLAAVIVYKGGALGSAIACVFIYF